MCAPIAIFSHDLTLITEYYSAFPRTQSINGIYVLSLYWNIQYVNVLYIYRG